MTTKLRLTCLINDTAGPIGLPVEHGLAFLLETDTEVMLFDTGQSGLVVENARRMGLDLSRVKRIALSHGHSDHTGGVAAVLNMAPAGSIYLHPAALERKFSRRTGRSREIGMPEAARHEIARRGWELIKTVAPTEVISGVCVTGPIPRAIAFEEIGSAFYLDEKGTLPDPLVDDQALYFMAREGLVVILGCAHAGVINTLQYIQKLSGGKEILAVLGGMHLIHAPIGHLTAVTEGLRSYGVRVVAPCHCTGSAATAMLRNQVGRAFHDCGAGSQFVFDMA